jgi:AraC-like DNA-binding protein
MLRQPEVTGPFRFSTRDVPVHQRADAIFALRERNILPIEPLPDRVADARITRWPLPGAGILAGSFSGVIQEGSPKAQGVSDELFFGINVAGSSTAFQCEREATFGDGGAVLLSCAERSFRIPRPTAVEFVGLRVPRKRLAPLVAGIDDKVMQVAPGTTYALQLLNGYLRAMLKEEVLSSPEISRLVVTHLFDLIALSLGATRDGAAAAQAGVRAARLQAIKSDIAARLFDCSLTIAAIAARHGVTPRYVHKLFESEGTTFTQFVLRQRLDHAYRMLRDHRFAMRSISSIAYDVGFGDLSYFNRAFRQQYNATPSDIRHDAIR